MVKYSRFKEIKGKMKNLSRQGTMKNKCTF